MTAGDSSSARNIANSTGTMADRARCSDPITRITAMIIRACSACRLDPWTFMSDAAAAAIVLGFPVPYDADLAVALHQCDLDLGQSLDSVLAQFARELLIGQVLAPQGCGARGARASPARPREVS